MEGGVSRSILSGDRGRCGSGADKVICGNIEVPGKLRQGVGVRRALIIILNETDVRTLEPRIGSLLPLLTLYQNRCSHQILYHSYLQKSILLCKQKPILSWPAEKIGSQRLLLYPPNLDDLLQREQRR
jgi:hypothetical protein